MNLTVLLLILMSVLLSAIAQITLKMGMSSPIIQQAIASASNVAVFQRSEERRVGKECA